MSHSFDSVGFYNPDHALFARRHGLNRAVATEVASPDEASSYGNAEYVLVVELTDGSLNLSQAGFVAFRLVGSLAELQASDFTQVVLDHAAQYLSRIWSCDRADLRLTVWENARPYHFSGWQVCAGERGYENCTAFFDLDVFEYKAAPVGSFYCVRPMAFGEGWAQRFARLYPNGV